jgi:hypothetical protein
MGKNRWRIFSLYKIGIGVSEGHETKVGLKSYFTRRISIEIKINHESENKLHQN